MNRIDVFIPTKNSAKTILKTLESLIIADIPINWLIIIDAYSNDNTLEIIKDWCMKYKVKSLIGHASSGLGNVRLIAETRLIQTDIYLSLDSDIILSSNFFKSLYPQIMKDSDLVYISSFILWGDKDSLEYKISQYQNSIRNYQPCIGTTLIRKGIADFNYMEDISIGEDAIFTRYLLANNKKCKVDYNIYSYHPRSYISTFKHLISWGKGAREIGNTPLIELIRFLRTFVTGIKMTIMFKDIKLLIYSPIRGICHLHGYMIGEGSYTLTIKEELQFIKMTRKGV